ncbi:MAG: universal stress protein [Bdellovibrionales bacterium]
MSKIRVTKSAVVKNVSARRKASGKLWIMAVDPFTEFDLKALKSFTYPLAEKAGAQVQATYVLAPASLNWSGDFNPPWMKKYVPVSEASLADALQGDPVTWKVVTCKESGQRASVNALLSHAKKAKAECIVLSTHARKGLERWALGSFAETLMLASKIPLIVVNPSYSVPSAIQKILVPTDLSKRSEKFVLSLTRFAKSVGAEMILYYKQPDPLDPIVQQGVYALGGGWVSVQSYMDEELSAKTKQLQKLESVISSKGVPVRHIVETSPTALVESINKAATDHGCDLTAVLTHAGALTAALLGSVARGLVRHSPVPVFVQRE